MTEQETKFVFTSAYFGGETKLNRKNRSHLGGVPQGGVPGGTKSPSVVNLLLQAALPRPFCVILARLSFSRASAFSLSPVT